MNSGWQEGQEHGEYGVHNDLFCRRYQTKTDGIHPFLASGYLLHLSAPG